MALLVAAILCVGLMPVIGVTVADVAESGGWVGGDSSCKHPSEFVHKGFDPSGKGQHNIIVSCGKCGATQKIATESCFDDNGDGECDACH